MSGNIYSWPMQKYLDCDAIASGDLRAIALRSPLDYKHGGATETDAMRLGTATHCLTLEPERFADTHAIWRETDSKGKPLARNPRFKKWTDFQHANRDKNIILPRQYADAKEQAQVIRSEPQAAQLITLSGGVAEASIVVQMAHWKIKIRPDWHTATATTHLKGVHTTNPRKLWLHAHDMGWHISFALYHDVMRLFDGREREDWVVVCRNSRPYYAKALIIPDDFMDEGRSDYEAALEKRDECIRAGHWPGDLDEYTCIELPPHVKRRRQLEEQFA